MLQCFQLQERRTVTYLFYTSTIHVHSSNNFHDILLFYKQQPTPKKLMPVFWYKSIPSQKIYA